MKIILTRDLLAIAMYFGHSSGYGFKRKCSRESTDLRESNWHVTTKNDSRKHWSYFGHCLLNRIFWKSREVITHINRRTRTPTAADTIRE